MFVHFMFQRMPYERVTLGPAYAVRLSDLAATDALVTECMKCGRSWRVPPHHLYAKYRAHTWIRDIVFFFRCTNCGFDSCTWHTERAYHEHDRIN